MFRTLISATALIVGVAAVATPAFAGKGQCYTASGKPIGGHYNTDHPNYAFIQSVIANGGTCTGVSPSYGQDYSYPQYYDYGYRRPYYRPYYQPYSQPYYQLDYRSYQDDDND